MGDAVASLSSFAAAHGLEAVPSVDAGPLTPLLVESGAGRIAPAARGALGDGFSGAIGRLVYKRNKTFRFTVALTEVPASTAFAPRVFCVRSGRSTRDDEFYGFEARHSKLWTESIALNERYRVATSPFQDQNWLRQLFTPAFVDWLAHQAPSGFSFELAYGALLCSTEEDHPDPDALAALAGATAHIARRIAAECGE
ncbi:MAG: hypothetical protein JST59_08315 [Actinobacteria bacterium]|nr:hypothetical protein [Actinomycetota bacterium]